VNRVARTLGVALAVLLLLLPLRLARSDDEPAAGEASGGDKGEKKKPAEKSDKSDLVAKVGTEISGYTDSDAVTVVTPTISGSVENPLSEWSVGGRYLVDVVSAASVDIVATASQAWREVRQEGSLSAAGKIGEVAVGASGGVSVEPDYVSGAGGGTLGFDFYEKNVTTIFGYSYGHDTIGRTGTPFSVFSRNVDRHSLNGGLTVIVNRSTLLALVTDVIIENGDQSKPYRYIPMFAPSTVARVPNGASIDVVNALRLPERPLEQLPLSRDRFALTARLAHRFTDSTIRLEERFYQDTWGLTATSTDLQYIIDLGRRVSIWPHARLHLQAPVTFWQRAYDVVYTPGGAWNIPALRTGDRELGPLRALTGGGGLRVAVGPDTDPTSWVIGLRGDAIYTGFLDDLYITQRTSGFGALTLDTVFE
jgi:hypothetical protein